MPIEPKRSGRYADAMKERDYNQHRARLAKQTSCIDNITPASCAYTRPIQDLNDSSCNGGVPVHRRARQQQIEQDNHKLVGRMVHIMHKGGGIDNSEPWRDHGKAAASQYRRNAEQQRIANENAKLLERLERTQPTYRIEKFEADRTRNEAIASRISRYPYQPMDQTNSVVRSRTDVL